VPASITTAELRQLVEGIRFIGKMETNPVDKDLISQELAPMRNLFTKSVVVRMDLPAGIVLQKEHLTVKKPGTGIPATRLPELIGRRLTRHVKADEILQDSDLA
jgi:N-acetylneuraminate synthase